jgi:hypothetical protein
MTYVVPSLAGLIIACFAYFFKRIQDKVDVTLSEEQIRMLVNDKIAPILKEQENIHEDISKLGDKLDTIISFLIERAPKRDDD